MEVKILEKTDNRLRFLVEGVEVPYVNALRRIMLAEVPSMVVDEVVFLENSSMLQDEILAHRLGLIPLKTDLKSYNLPEECTCKSEFGCNLCRLSLTLDAEATDTPITVYSQKLVSENPNVQPVDDRIPIVKLAPEQKLKLEAYARLGKGKNHAKWQPVSACAYTHLPQISFDIKRCTACADCVKLCPEKVLLDSVEGIRTSQVVNCNRCMQCVDACPQNPPAIEVAWNKTAFVFKIESTGALPVENIVVEAVKILNNKTKAFIKQLKVRKK